MTSTPKRVKEESIVSKDEWREYTKTVWSIANVRNPKHPAVFPEEIPHRLIKLFSFVGETVLDPFAGIGTTGKVAVGLNRKAVCIDQNEDYLKMIPDDPNLTTMKGDCRDMHVLPDEYADLIVTSPPYWDKADYGDGEGNLGNMENYAAFMEEMRHCFRECYRVLQSGRKMCIVVANVNQQTNHGLLTFPVSTDMAVVMRDVGFVMVQEVVWSKDGTGGPWGSSNDQKPIFGSYPYPPNFLFKNVHEYILIFSKPGGKERRGPKVKQYEELMGHDRK